LKLLGAAPRHSDGAVPRRASSRVTGDSGYTSAISVKRSRGERISDYVPFGWDFGRDGRLVENASEQEIIARMRRPRVEGSSYLGIASRMDGEGILPKRGRRWIHTTAIGILARNAT
jgi:hypothetical protein